MSSELAAAGFFQPLGADDPQMVAGYRIAARLGSGGMGKVYLSHTPGGRPVAIKVIRQEFADDPEFRHRFKQEVVSAQRVQGLFTAPVIDADADGPVPWLATAYVPGPTVAAAVAEHGPLPARTVLMLVAGIAEALQVIHGAGIVHRDLKPSNVLLASDGPRVIDFGIARAADATSLTASGVAIGTPSFMAPEQAAGGRIGAATDVFALGQVAVYAASGAPAYGEGPSHGVLYRIVHEEPDLSGLPAELRPLVERCLVKVPAERASLTEILELCRAAADQTQLRRQEDWLPSGLAAGITSRQGVVPGPVAAPGAPVPTPAAAGGPVPTAPAHQLPPMPAGLPTQAGVAHQPTAPAHPAVHAASAPGVPAVPAQSPAFNAPYQNPYPPTGAYRAPTPAPYFPTPPPPPKRNRSAIVLGAIFGSLVLLLGGCAALANVIGKGNDDRRSASSGSTAPQGGGGAASARPSTDPTPASYPGFEFPAGYHIKLGDDPLTPHDSNYDDLYLSCGGSSIGCTFGSYGTRLVLLDSAEKGSLKTCREVTRFTTQIKVETLSKGAEICMRTKSGNVGLILFKGMSAQDDPSVHAKVDVTVWRGGLAPQDK
ncbi:serine/threonine protein kinase [Streptomyces sp. NPDC006463]|uniref:serine/threonine protein kinase n=1 Tax=Streptomyces sp. NPDC006463 TaxID=3364746 RepID=UPI003692157C